MANNLRYFKKTGLIFAISLICNSLSSQEIVVERHANAEKVFNSFLKVGFEFGLSTLFTSNEDNAIDYHIPNINASYWGFNYNFFQKGNFNFKASLLFKKYDLKEYEHVKAEDFGDEWDYITLTVYRDYRQTELLMATEYFLALLLDKVYLTASLGPSIVFHKNNPDSGSFGIIANPNLGDDETTWPGATYEGEYDGKMNFGVHASIRFALKFKYLLVQPYVLFNYQPTPFYTNTVRTRNLFVSENTVSRHKITGNYLAFGLKIAPALRLFSKDKSG